MYLNLLCTKELVTILLCAHKLFIESNYIFWLPVIPTALIVTVLIIHYFQYRFPLQVRLRESCMERELKKALHTVTCPITYKGNS